MLLPKALSYSTVGCLWKSECCNDLLRCVLFDIFKSETKPYYHQ